MDSGNKHEFGKIRRQRVVIFYQDQRKFEAEVCDIAMPSPDGRYFLVRDVTAGEKVGEKGKSFDGFFNTDLIDRIEVSTRVFWINKDGSRGEEVLDTEPEKPQIIT